MGAYRDAELTCGKCHCRYGNVTDNAPGDAAANFLRLIYQRRFFVVDPPVYDWLIKPSKPE
jgi:hypothetical protein